MMPFGFFWIDIVVEGCEARDLAYSRAFLQVREMAVILRSCPPLSNLPFPKATITECLMSEQNVVDRTLKRLSEVRTAPPHSSS